MNRPPSGLTGRLTGNIVVRSGYDAVTRATGEEWLLGLRIPAWAPYTLPKRTTLVFDHQTHVEDDPRAQFRQFWEKEPPRA